MVNRPEYLQLEQLISRPKIDKIVNQLYKVNPRVPDTYVIKAVQNQLPPLQSIEASLQQTNNIQRSVLERKKAFEHRP
jgi:hypothetical protein